MFKDQVIYMRVRTTVFLLLVCLTLGFTSIYLVSSNSYDLFFSQHVKDSQNTLNSLRGLINGEKYREMFSMQDPTQHPDYAHYQEILNAFVEKSTFISYCFTIHYDKGGLVYGLDGEFAKRDTVMVRNEDFYLFFYYENGALTVDSGEGTNSADFDFKPTGTKKSLRARMATNADGQTVFSLDNEKLISFSEVNGIMAVFADGKRITESSRPFFTEIDIAGQKYNTLVSFSKSGASLSFPNEPLLESPRERAFYSKALAGIADNDKYFFYDDSSGKMLSFYTQLYDKSGLITGLLCSEIEQKWLDEHREEIYKNTARVFLPAFLLLFLLLLVLFEHMLIKPFKNILHGLSLEMADCALGLENGAGARDSIVPPAMEETGFSTVGLSLEDAVRSYTNEIKRSALQDGLTSCNNRQYYQQVVLPRLKELLVGTEKVFGIVMLDIDHFKQINDTYGHAAGDEVLTSLCQNIRSHIRTDDVFMRMGGEEFLIVMNVNNINILGALSDKIRRDIETRNMTVQEGKTQIKCTCSFGYTLLPVFSGHRTALTVEQTLELADLCLYRAKKTGRNKCVGINARPVTSVDGFSTTSLDENVEKGFMEIVSP